MSAGMQALRDSEANGILQGTRILRRGVSPDDASAWERGRSADTTGEQIMLREWAVTQFSPSACEPIGGTK